MWKLFYLSFDRNVVKSLQSEVKKFNQHQNDKLDCMYLVDTVVISSHNKELLTKFKKKINSNSLFKNKFNISDGPIERN